MTTSETEPSLSADEQYQQSLTYGLIISTGLLSIMICSLRLYARAFILKRFGMDDIAVCISLALDSSGFTMSAKGVK
ncbi:hypothetical protein N7494_001438 [Penicillium frequentans]|uniref:Uncharacterized protein n=1 Tax=Penicillium frequentans TaxID=3151616 RepID=A0AAD6GM87_9EURO|nr:hypothetical protein N7494_001438 [Penicillium glabrum]